MRIRPDFSKAMFSIFVKPAGNSTLFRLVQPLKAAVEIVFKFAGR